jgi:hypothetical protein
MGGAGSKCHFLLYECKPNITNDDDDGDNDNNVSVFFRRSSDKIGFYGTNGQCNSQSVNNSPCSHPLRGDAGDICVGIATYY